MIKIIFVQLLYQMNFIRMKLDFFKFFYTAMRLMLLLICFARAEDFRLMIVQHPIVFLYKSPILVALEFGDFLRYSFH